MDSSYLAQAIVQCEQAIQSETDHPEAWQSAFKNLGNLLQGQAEFDRAIVWHSLALESKLNLAEAYSQLGELHIIEKNWTAALGSFEHALEYLPNSARIYSALAQINSQLQRKEAEMECWYKATQLSPNLVNNQGYYKLAKAFEQRGKIPEAIACYQKATAEGTGAVAAFFDLGELYQRQRKLDEAQGIYEQILAADPEEARAQYKLGTVYLQKQSFEQAISCFRQAIKYAPDFPWAYRDLVKTFLITQKWDEAISTCYAIINLVEEFPWVYSHLGNALREKGRLSEAAANFQKACEQRGWDQCVTNDYFFTADVFSHRISIWTEHLQSLMGTVVNALEVGCYQGMSSCWLLDRVLTHQDSKLSCIDSKFESKLKENIIKTDAGSKVTFLEGDIHQQMAQYTPASFELINLQDRCKLSQHVETDTQLAWELLKPGGLMIFSYYGWRHPRDPLQDPKAGIDRFLTSVKDHWQPVHFSPSTLQLIMRKL
ncbi:MAG: tetratricopeptide repeat protein [Cyanobacteria bacterium P01_A01_bin.40]